MPVAKDASRRIVDLLVGSGVRMQVWRLPAELREPRGGPSLQPDDLLDFHLLLQTDTWFDELASGVQNALAAQPEASAAQRNNESHPSWGGDSAS